MKTTKNLYNKMFRNYVCYIYGKKFFDFSEKNMRNICNTRNTYQKINSFLYIDQKFMLYIKNIMCNMKHFIKTERYVQNHDCPYLKFFPIIIGIFSRFWVNRNLWALWRVVLRW